MPNVVIYHVCAIMLSDVPTLSLQVSLFTMSMSVLIVPQYYISNLPNNNVGNVNNTS